MLDAQPFDFSAREKDGVVAELNRFTDHSHLWKPADFDTDANLRLAYYLDRQLPDTQVSLQRRFPNTWQDMLPVMLPITRHFVNEQARVFLNSTRLDLFQVDDDEEVDPASDLGRWWDRLQRDIGLRLRLKNVDRYTTLFHTCFLKVSRIGKRLMVYPFFPQLVDVVFDADHPFDLDMAHGVRVEIGSEYGAAAGSGSTVLGPDGRPVAMIHRYEFWCARPGEEQFRIIRSDGTVEATDFDDTFPFRRPDGSAFVPFVMFTGHTEELGAFTMSGQGLHLFNRAANIAATDLQHIAETQGFGQMVISTQPGYDPPSKIVRGPNRAIVLKEGSKAEMLSGNAAIQDLTALLDQQLKRAAVLNGIPAGAVSLEARAAASGIALQIEMRPLMELRQDAVEVYAAPMVRLWDVIAGVYNATLQPGENQIPDDVEMRWHPGDVAMPVDPRAELEDALARYDNDLCTKAEIIAELRHIPLDEAQELAEKIAAENAQAKRTALTSVQAQEAKDITGGGGSQGADSAQGALAQAATDLQASGMKVPRLTPSGEVGRAASEAAASM